MQSWHYVKSVSLTSEASGNQEHRAWGRQLAQGYISGAASSPRIRTHDLVIAGKVPKHQSSCRSKFVEMDDDEDLHNVREEDDSDSEQEEEGGFEWEAQEDPRDFDWVEEVGLDTQASEGFSSTSPAERSGHVAVVDRGCMYVWGGYKVSGANTSD